ncbi:hypothetical protein Val02_76390 [Virgisporangium aliadipatigenens]|uniref:Uncharacterized protein n=1 Tax=Virgisporangium aliadipatigenens TaxID=741659 RepID=A0A8J3YW24_9ACTN|nr:hypothetical protein [Virgisporangium aliadipatigenens]GIJ50753.1 hypothetical protein Val02_76390 [Virgisporangium aliadipatigenens]
MSGTNDGWASPSLSPVPASGAVPPMPPAAALAGTAAAGLPFDPDSNYGFAGPPRPPAPPREPGARTVGSAVVTTAVGLSYTGVAVALAEILLIMLALAGAVSQDSGDLNSTVERLVVEFYAMLVVFAWLVPAAGVVLAATHTRRGSNVARFLLAALLGALGLLRVCALGQAVINPDSTTSLDQAVVVSISISSMVLGTMALVAAVLLLTPPAQRYFEGVHRS